MHPGISYPPIPIVEIGPLALSFHGVFAAVGFAVGAWWMLRRAQGAGFTYERVSSVLTWALVGSLLGARLLTVPADLISGVPLTEAFSLRGSFSIIGGYVGGVAAGWWRIRMLGLPFLRLADLAAPAMALGGAIGRIGDLIIVEHLGRETNFFLGYTVKPGYDLAPQHDVLECATGLVCGTYHHTALYDLIGMAILFWVFLRLPERWRRRYVGQLFAFWMFWYGIQRFLIDFTRIGGANADRMAGPLTWSQWSALVLGLAGMYLIYWLEGRTAEVSSVEEDLAPRFP